MIKELDGKERRALYQAVFCSAEGKRVLADLEQYAGFRRSAFDPDPYKHAFRAGKVDVLQFIATQIEPER